MSEDNDHEFNEMHQYTSQERQQLNQKELEEFDAQLSDMEEAKALVVDQPKLLEIKKRPDLYAVPSEVRELANDKRIAILPLVKFKVECPDEKLPDGILEDLAEKFSVSNRQVQRWIFSYVAYRVKFPSSPGAESFLPVRPGPPRQQQFTEDQEDVLLYAIATRQRFLRSAKGITRWNAIPFSILDVYRYAKSVFDQLGQSFPAYSTVVKFVDRLREREPELLEYMVLGSDAGHRNNEEKRQPKRRNDVSGPNVRWQTDVKESQVYVESNGKRYTFAILAIYDDYSRYIIWWKLFLKEVKEDGSGTKGVTTRVWTTAIATAMYHTNTTPKRFYYDNAKYYLASDGSLNELPVDSGAKTRTTKSKPKRPEGRGKVENLFGQLVSMLDRMSGRYNNRAGIAAAKKAEDPFSFDEAEQEFDRKRMQWNNSLHRSNGKKTRFEVWSEAMASPAPPIRKLAQLPEIEHVFVSITFKEKYNWSLPFKGKEWEPRLYNADVHTLWARAVAGAVTVPMWAVKLDTGWVAEVCLDEEKEIWVEIIEKGSQPHDSEAHNRETNASLADLEKRRKAIEKNGEASVKRLIGGMPIAEVSSGEYIDIVPDGKLPRRNKLKQQAQPERQEDAEQNEEDANTSEVTGLESSENSAETLDYDGYLNMLKQKLREKE